tara:strand:- start:92 stop:433 length:342 start_codon:yes stop_codon:yes gene_type:complete
MRYGIPNLLEKHPEGLGNLIEVYPLSSPQYRVDGYFFKDNITTNKLPFMASLDSKAYLIILGEGLVKSLPHEFDVDYAGKVIKEDLKTYTDKIWNYLGIDLSTLYIQLIGWQC